MNKNIVFSSLRGATTNDDNSEYKDWNLTKELHSYAIRAVTLLRRIGY